ncbi:EAL domain-containing protein [Celerinatantimonas yamalensis]|uniref:Bifunctional diguanylate cyclase/phosphodiesterase n=1 Tax=Celerinatantimonas yamalensis TaxID=559956 RepID=A0ABW9GA68_9GAMM
MDLDHRPSGTFQFDDQHMRDLFEQCLAPSFICDTAGNILCSNQAAMPLCAGRRTHLSALFEMTQHEWQSSSKRVVMVKPPYQQYYKFRSQPLESNPIVWLVQVCPQINSFDNLNRELHRTLYCDSLTQLPNHQAWFERSRSDSSSPSALVLLKLNNMRTLNVQLSFSTGNELLQRISAGLVAELGADIKIYRFPGAKFLLVLTNPCLDLSIWMEHKLRSSLPEAISVADNGMVYLDWKCGGTYYCPSTLDQALLEECAIALGHCSAGSIFQVYQRQYSRIIAQRNHQQERIYEALDQHRLELWLQAQSSYEGNVVGYEGLARLIDADGNVMMPDDFLPYIDANNWHCWLSRQVWQQATQMLEHWPDQHSIVPLSINLAGPELLDDTFFSLMLHAYQQSPRLRKRLSIELTETSKVGQLSKTKQRLTILTELGVTVFIDDFGTGHASLAQLVDVSISALKIDRLFVSQVIHSPKHACIIKASVQLAQNLGLKVIAEGVENQQQLEALSSLGCVIFQGFLFSRPQPYHKLCANLY